MATRDAAKGSAVQVFMNGGEFLGRNWNIELQIPCIVGSHVRRSSAILSAPEQSAIKPSNVTMYWHAYAFEGISGHGS